MVESPSYINIDSTKGSAMRTPKGDSKLNNPKSLSVTSSRAIPETMPGNFRAAITRPYNHTG
jgi:hypothetical protein